MKKLVVFIIGMVLFLQQTQAQIATWLENFDGNIPPTGWTIQLGVWESNPYYSLSSPQSYRGVVPKQIGDMTILQTPMYDCSMYDYVYLRFSHICKVSPRDRATIEFRINGVGAWTSLPKSTYLDTAVNYATVGFNAASYADWRANDSTALPAQSWWKNEKFDLTAITAGEQIEFRFVIEHGNVIGTQASYGWLLDNFQLQAANFVLEPPTVYFVEPFVRDTVYSTGPWEITAVVKTNTNAPIVQPWLIYTASPGGTDSILMTHIQGDSLWKASIPKFPAGTTVSYSITGRDTNGNAETAYSGYYIGLPPCGTSSSGFSANYTYTGSVQPVMLDDGVYELECWGADGGGGNVGKGGYSRGTYIVSAPATFYVYVGGRGQTANGVGGWNGGGNTQNGGSSGGGGGTDIRTTQNATYSDRIIVAGGGGGEGTTSVDGAGGHGGGITGLGGYSTTVAGYISTYEAGHGGTQTAGGSRGIIGGLTGQTDGVFGMGGLGYGSSGGGGGGGWYGGGGGLHHGGGGGSGYIAGLTGSAVTAYTTQVDFVANPVTDGNGYVRITALPGRLCLDNSVALTQIVAPTQSTVVGGQNNQVKVIIVNRGDLNLTSCTINWQINSTLQTPYPWNGSLPWDFDDTVAIGNYPAGLNRYDTIVAWVTMPNGQLDSVAIDDTARTVIYGCSGGTMSGNFTIGTASGNDFSTMNEALNALFICGAGGDIRFLLANDTYTDSWNFSNVNNSIMNGYTLTVASQSGNKNDVIVQPSSGSAVTLNNTRNLRLESLTFNGRIANTYVVNFTDACTNIVIKNCSMLADTTVTGSGREPLYKGSTGVVDSFQLINCFLEGGYYNAYFYGGISNTAGMFGTNIIFDSNTFKSGYYYSLQVSYSHVLSISHNTFLNRVSNNGSYWYGLYLSSSNADRIVGNRIKQRAGTTTYTYGHAIYLTSANTLPVASPNPMLVANNEIMLSYSGTSSGEGIYEASSGLTAPIHYLHNSIYIASTGTGTADQRGIYYTSPSTATMHVAKKNNIYMEHTNAYPIYLATAFTPSLYDIDNNNLYAPNNIGYASGTQTSMEDWQNVVTSDYSSVRVLPSYIDNTSLELNDYTGLACLRSASVTEDILGTSRQTTTPMGCYTSNVSFSTDVMLSRILDMKSTLGGYQGDTLKVELFNAGLNAVNTTATLCWRINGVNQTSVARAINLQPGEGIILPLNSPTYISGINTAEVYLCGLGSLTDGNPLNDTAKLTKYVCGSTLSGTIYIPGDYADINSFADALDSCGNTGTITLYFTGQYSGNLDFGAISQKLKEIPLIITGDTIFPPGGNAVTIGQNKNITFEDITIQSYAGYCIYISNAACSDIAIRNCRLLADPNTASSSNACIYKTSGGLWNNVAIIGNQLDGGYYNAYLYGASSSSYSNNIVFDSNICTNSYSYGVYCYYQNIRIAHNQIACRPSGSSSTWYGVNGTYTNATVDGNRILAQSSTSMTGGAGIYFQYANTNNTTAPMYVTNNEIRYLNGIYPSYGIYMAYAGNKAMNYPVNVVHNSIYIAGNGGHGIYISTMTQGTNFLKIKNNSICLFATGTNYPIYLTTAFNTDLYDIDANNMYAPTYVGYVNTNARTTMDAWKSVVTTDTRSIRMIPPYINVSDNLEMKLDDYLAVLCPVFSGVAHDIMNETRVTTTPMGCYTVPISNFDLTNVEVVIPDVVQNQTVVVKAKILSSSAVTITDATWGWSLNGVPQTPLPLHTFIPPLTSMQMVEVPVGSFLYTGQDTSDIVVWIDQVNGLKDDKQSNDTARLFVQHKIVPLAEFVAPFVDDTITQRAFDVYAKIHTASGAPVSPPQLQVKSVVNGNYTSNTTIPMILENGIWTAKVSNQYYGSNVVYSLSVSDTVGNSITIMDSVYLNYVEKIDTIIVGTGTSNGYYFPIYSSYLYTWGREFYLYNEICTDPTIQNKGTYITKIAFQGGQNASYTYTNQKCYLRATTNTTVPSSGYKDPIAQGATLVYDGTWVTSYPWSEITLDIPFFLPPGMNLEIYWDNEGRGNTNSMSWTAGQVLNIAGYTAYLGYSNVDWAGAMGTNASGSGYRTNTRFVIGDLVNPYSGYNLSLLKVTEPVNKMEGACAADTSAVKVVLTNTGENNYDFTKNDIAIFYEITDPMGTVYNDVISIYDGSLQVKKDTVITLKTDLPVMYAGEYSIKAWVSSLVDRIPYDDTILYVYKAGKVGLPVDEDFSSPILPSDFVSLIETGVDTWMPFQPDANFAVQPTYGTGMLRFEGTQGSGSILRTRQLDMFGATNPRLDFWYYHDTTSSILLDETYTEVRVVVDGVPKRELTLYKRSGPHGWQQHTVNLNQYTSAKCVYIEFVSVSDDKLGAITAQYIDRIVITSDQDLAVSEIIVTPEILPCSMDNKEIFVVVRTIMNQAVDFSRNQTTLRVVIPGGTIDYPLISGRIEGNSSDTFRVASGIDFTKGSHTLLAYLNPPIDQNGLNDTARLPLNINPSLTATMRPISSTNNCLSKDAIMQQVVTVKNTGNMDLSEIEVILEITDNNGGMIPPSYNTTIHGVLLAGDSTDISFFYDVPAEKYYWEDATVYLSCDPLVNNKMSVRECVDIDDLLIRLLKPLGTEDEVGDSNEIEILISNMSDQNTYGNINITARIEKNDGTLIQQFAEVLQNSISPLDSVSHTFKDKYAVLDAMRDFYFIKVFINSQDMYPQNDTVLVVHNIKNVGINITEISNVFALGQNVPNPANNSTFIEYSIPTSGEVIFNVHAVSGQLLHSQVLMSEQGKHIIELNTNSFAAGVYFYSIEYKSQKLVRRMSVKD